MDTQKSVWRRALPEFQKPITNKESVWAERSPGSFEPLSPWPCESRSQAQEKERSGLHISLYRSGIS